MSGTLDKTNTEIDTTKLETIIKKVDRSSNDTKFINRELLAELKSIKHQLEIITGEDNL